MCMYNEKNDGRGWMMMVMVKKKQLNRPNGQTGTRKKWNMEKGVCVRTISMVGKKVIMETEAWGV